MLSLIFITAFTVLFINATFWEGMIFSRLADMMDHWPSWLKKPLYDCPICMSVWHGIALHLLGTYFGAWPFLGLFQMVIMVFAAGGVNAVLIYIIENGKNSEDCSSGTDSE